jgi:hypothetical protein
MPESMKEGKSEMILERAKEKYPEAKHPGSSRTTGHSGKLVPPCPSSTRCFSCRAAANGGPGRDRTGDLIVANDALSQLSYRPIYLEKNSAPHAKLPYPLRH